MGKLVKRVPLAAIPTLVILHWENTHIYYGSSPMTFVISISGRKQITQCNFAGSLSSPSESLILLRKSAKQTRLYAHNPIWQLKPLHPLSTGKMPKNSDSYWFTRCCDVILTTLLACSESLTSSSGNGLKLHKTRKQITCCSTGWHCDNLVFKVGSFVPPNNPKRQTFWCERTRQKVWNELWIAMKMNQIKQLLIQTARSNPRRTTESKESLLQVMCCDVSWPGGKSSATLRFLMSVLCSAV